MSGAGHKLRLEVIAFERPAAGTDGAGNHVTGAWDRVFEDRAHVRYLRGGETVIGARLAGNQPAVFTVLSGPDVDQVRQDWRIVDLQTNRVFGITSYVLSDDQMTVEFTCAETPAESQADS